MDNPLLLMALAGRKRRGKNIVEHPLLLAAHDGAQLTAIVHPVLRLFTAGGRGVCPPREASSWRLIRQYPMIRTNHISMSKP